MSQYPQELPSAAITELWQFVSGAEHDKAKVVHACYDIIGYGLGTAFGEGDYDMPADAHAQLATFSEAGSFGEKIPSWVIKLALGVLSKLLGV